MNNSKKYFLSIFIILMFAQFAYSWGSVGHKIINRKSPMHLPATMSQFKADSLFYEAHASDADTRRVYTDTTMFAEQWRHYIDIDDYPDFHNLPQNFNTVIMLYTWNRVKNNGINPWSTLWVLDSLTAQLSRFDTEKVKQTASDLGHYVADGHMPLHCTINYNGQLTNNYGIHSRYESNMVNTYQSQLTISPASANYISSPSEYIFNYIYHSISLVDTILQADTYAKAISGWNGSGSAPSSYYTALWTKTQNITKDQFQRATVAIADLWYTAFVNASYLNVNNDKETPNECALYQNYPNPFNPKTIINYQLSNDQYVTLKIFDVLGREVATLVDGFEEAGYKSVEFNAANIPGGLYFYRLVVSSSSQTGRFEPMTAGSITNVKKMMLLK